MFKKIILINLCLLLFFNLIINVNAESTKDYDTVMKQDLLVLMLAYPDYITNIEKDDSNKVYIVMKSNKKILYDTKTNKSPEEKLANPDLKDVLEQEYPLTKNIEIMSKDFNPGRIRNYDLLNEVYGNSKKAIESNLVGLKYGYPNYQFNSHNNANTSLESALKTVIPLSKGNYKISNILYPASGTYNYRIISGTNRLSPHSYGIAIDLKSDKRDYWKWSSAEQGKTRISEYPEELIKAFEDNNFIWGGKWGYFDILHFEYRPEIILKAKYFSNCNNSDNWYDGAPADDAKVQECIDIINKSLQ